MSYMRNTIQLEHR